MTRILNLSVGLAGLFALFAVQPPLATTPQIPPGDTTFPTGHPQVEPGAPPADPKDVVSVNTIIDAYYASLSGPRGQARNWMRFRSLFIPNAQFITLQPMGKGVRPLTLDPEKYIAVNDRYFSKGGYFEDDVNRIVEEYGRIATAFSTYESRHVAHEAPYSRGINSFQLVHDGQRWWITSMVWERENSETNPLPAKYLAPSDD